MNTPTYLRSLTITAIVIAVIAAALFIGFGARWFSYYGWAIAVLLGVFGLGTIVLKRYRALGLRRWPVIMWFIIVAIGAIIQAGFWYAFFNSGSTGLTLAAGRSFVMPLLEPVLMPVFALAAALSAWIIARGAMLRTPTKG
ncbi:MAG: hypothetical protein RIC14_16325 [Filomicrobium sp.]